jgi:hypothetical protein
MNFFTINFKNEIEQNVIKAVFPKLRSDHQNILIKYLWRIIRQISSSFCFDPTKKIIYEQQLRQNNYRDLRGLLLLLLPFIDETLSSTTEIKSLNDIYVAKRSDGVQDLNLGQPKYIYSNIQFNRCIREKDNIKERIFDMSHLEHNYILIINTLEEISNKLYVNWIDVRPISNLDYIDTRLFKLTQLANNNGYSLNNNKYKGLRIGDIYNCFSKYFFDEVKDVKWLIYIYVYGTQELPYLTIIDKILNLGGIYSGKNWESLTDEEISSFKKSWETFISKMVNGRTIDEYDNEVLQLIAKSITVFFERKYHAIQKAIRDGYITLQESIDDDDMEAEIEEKRIYQMDVTDMLQSINSIRIDHLYNFIQFTFERFVKTWYGKSMTVYDKKLQSYVIKEYVDFEGTLANSPLDIPVKLIYNYAKSLTHHNVNGKFTPLPRLWKSLNRKQQEIIVNRLNNTEKDWFNISVIIRKVFGLENVDDIKFAIKKTVGEIHFFTPNLIFDVLTSNGILSEIMPEPSITNLDKLPTNYSDRMKKIATVLEKNILKDEHGNIKKKYEESYYFLTNKKFKNMKDVVVKENGREVKKNYLNQMCEDFQSIGSWNTTYAMDWVSQIGFFHRYINNRVIFVTGATGVGKSSQVPKLLLYALKMVDYQIRGKIVCTQPRKAPTFGNASTISKQMGVPIEKYNERFEKMLPENNFYLQYKYQGKEHTKETSDLMLKIVTDGSLYNELVKSPLLKKVSMNRDGTKKFKRENMYDIVIVDEAHEHNSNMDMILTMIKYAINYNNSTKLVIISATMDQDEPTYRSFYRDINDNKIFPHSMILTENAVNLDRINADRRLHISPPGETTRFNITDVYKPGSNSDLIALDVIKNTSNGDILLFKPGESNINKSVQFLNNNLPSDCIALPFFGKMTEEKRLFIQEIDKNKYDLIIPQSINFANDYDENEIQKVSKGTYRRVVIVATNIAEASITVKSLRYVIETGTQKTSDYDHKLRTSQLVTIDISESSRLQRRGRVGRVADGTVIYVYPEGDKEDVKTAFGISIKDTSDDIYRLMRESYDELPLVPSSINPVFAKSIKLSQLMGYSDTISGVTMMIQDQYFVNEQYNQYIGNNTQYDYDNRKKPSSYYQTGYAKGSLVDNYGNFYIIHPEERSFTRNIIGQIVDTNNTIKYNDLQKRHTSPKVNSFINILTERLLIFKMSNKGYVKTEYGKKLYEIKERIGFEDIRDCITFLYSLSYKTSSYVLPSIIIKNLIDASVKSLFSQKMFRGKMQPNIELGKSVYGNNKGDCIAFAKIGSKIVSFMNNRIFDIKKIYNKKLSSETFRLLSGDLMDYKTDYLKNKETGKFTIVPYEMAHTLASLDNKGKLYNKNSVTDEEVKSLIVDNYYKDLLESMIDANEILIEKWAKSNVLNHVMVTRFMKTYIAHINELYKILNDMYDDESEVADIKWFEDKLVPIEEFAQSHPVIMPFIHGFGFNVALNIPKTDKFLPLANTEPYNVRGLSNVGKFKETLLNNNSLGGYVLFMDLSRTSRDLFGVNRITSRMIQQTVPFIFSPEYIKSERMTCNKNDRAIKHLRNSNKEGELNERILGFYLKAIEKIKFDMINEFDTKVYTNLLKLESNEYIDKYVDDYITNMKKMKY